MPIKTVRFFSLMWIFILPAVFWAGAGSGLIIYRFGGEGRPVPPEADSGGVDFRQRSWTDLDIDRRGQAIDLDMDAVAIRALERDPTFNLAPVIEELGGQPLQKGYKGRGMGWGPGHGLVFGALPVQRSWFYRVLQPEMH